jgi:carbohydrate kinase (thermoresistant glucokinase family)
MSGARGYAPVLIIMGVSGVGKSTIAQALAKKLGWKFQEGDELHPPSNVRKMHANIPLTDADRAPWLAAIKHWIDARLNAHEPGLVTCSALKRKYRAFLVEGRESVRILYLHADKRTIEDRISHRTGHFMPASMLESQLRTLEEPVADEHPIVIEVAETVDRTIEDICRKLGGLDRSHA